MWVVVAGEGVVDAGIGLAVCGFRVALVASEFVAGWAGGSLQASRVGNFLAVRRKVCVVAKQAGGLACTAAGGDGAGGAELVGEPVEDSACAVARGDAAATAII